ncbi:MAG: BREX-1 system adenine-specific DNA-methyltransferase PglX, partial [Lachnospiraceae bacterium]|nr:BREX-1 system adenine-specific DNA-methyltransferase PglX [Lachnospiraceae bacterium]
KKDFGVLVDELHDAKEYGSILNVSQVDFAALYARMDEVRNDISMYKEPTLKTILPLIQVAEALAQKYQVVVTNPPYMGSSSMGAKLGKYVKDNYPDSKSDLFAVFIEQCGSMTARNGYQAMITQHVWMFLSSFEKLRGKLLQKDTVNMAHLGSRAFEEIGGEVVQTTSFVLCNSHIADYNGIYCRLIEPTTQQGKEDMFLSGKNRYTAHQTNFAKIPGSPVAYWASKKIIDAFVEEKSLDKYADCCTGMQTGNNDLYVRDWYEINFQEFSTEYKKSNSKWVKYNCGGESRKWYGNHLRVINWIDNGQAVRKEKSSVIRNESHYFQEGISWKRIGSSDFYLRYLPAGFIFDQAGDSMFFKDSRYLKYALGFVNSRVALEMFQFIAPTLNLTAGNISKLPLKVDESKIKIISSIVNENIEEERLDWDSFETSWDFTRHPFICSVSTVSDAFTAWQNECADRFAQLKSNEEELNSIFIDIYGLRDELTPEVEDKDVTVRLADKSRDIRSFISYAVGCMFGRYSLDVDGLAYAGGEWDASKYSTYIPDKDGILPICDDEYFEDDIVNRFVDFVCAVYGKDTLEENLKFIADALGGKGAPRQVIRDYFINDFYADHLKVYQKRPIYWLFDSGKKNGFKCLIYIHRYKPDTIARIRTDYVHEQQARYRTAIAGLENQIANAGTGERVKLNKQLKKLQDQADELHGYEEKIHHLADQFISFDLDDGVKHNYEIFKDVLAKIK